MGQTRGEIKSDIKDNLSDLSLNFYGEDDLNDSVQDAYSDIAILTQCIQKKTALNWVPNLSYYSPVALGVSDYLGVIAIFNNVTNLWLRDDLSLKDFDRIRRDWENWTGTPQFWSPSDPVRFGIAAKYSSVFLPLQQFYNSAGFTFFNSFGTGYVHFITIGTITYSYVQQPSDGSSDIANALVNAINSSSNLNMVASAVGSLVILSALLNTGDTVLCSASDGNASKNVLELSNAITSGYFILYYFALAPALTSDTDTFQIAGDMQTLLTHYVTADLLEQAQEFGKASDYWNNYYQGIEDYADRVKRNVKSDLLLRI